MHGVPKSTLHDRISGNVTHGDKPGPDQLLSPAEKEEQQRKKKAIAAEKRL